MRTPLFLAALLASTAVNAQIIADSAYGATAHARYDSWSATMPPATVQGIATGANAHWVYSFIGTHGASVRFSEVAAQPAGPFAGATRKAVAQRSTSTDSSYYRSTAKGFLLCGQTFNGGAFYYKPNFFWVPYGLGLNQSRLDTSGSYSTTGGLSGYFLDSTALLGTGSISINGVAYDSVLYFYSVEKSYADSTLQGIPQITYQRYRFCIPGLGVPLLEFLATASMPNVTALYSENVVVATRSRFAAPLALYPNPATDKLHLSGLAGQAEVSNAAGQTQRLPIRLGGTVDVSALAPGIYQVRVGERVGRFVKE